MSESDNRLWLFKRKESVASALGLFLALFLIAVVLRETIDWPSKESETLLFIGILLFSFLPVLLPLLDVIIKRGGVIEYKGVKIDFSQVPQIGLSDITVPTNISSVPGQTVGDSSTIEILDSLKKAMACEVVIIDLDEGQAWWETRLLVLLAGAVRLNRPGKVVFVGKEGNIDQCFLGWGHPHDLLQRLLKIDPQYRQSYHLAQAVARRLELLDPEIPGTPPPMPPSIQSGLSAEYYSYMAVKEGLPNQLLAEQVLASELGKKVESGLPRTITLDRMEQIFYGNVLHKENIDESWAAELKIRKFFDSNADYLTVTQNRKYLKLVSRLTVLNAIMKTMLEQKRGG